MQESAARLDPALLEGDNPFRERIVADPWSPVDDVPAVHARATSELERLVATTRADGRARLAVLAGESGTGKSHILGRLRRRLGTSAFFVFVDPYIRADRAFRHMGLRVVESLWRNDDGEQRPIERLIDDVVLAALDQYMEGDPGPLAEHCSRLGADVRSGAFYADPDREPYLAHLLEAGLGAPARRVGREAIRALAGTRRPEVAIIARDWLRGVELDVEDLGLLGLPLAVPTEERARAAIVALAALVRGVGPLVLCFDQTESLPPYAGGGPGLGELLEALGQLRTDAENVVIVATCLGEVLRSSSAPTSDLALDLGGVDVSAARALVDARVRRRVEPPYPGYPFDGAFFAGLGDRIAARDEASPASPASGPGSTRRIPAPRASSACRSSWNDAIDAGPTSGENRWRLPDDGRLT